MAVKDILLALTTYPEPTPVSAVDDAVAVAAALGAKISAVACEVRFKAPHNVLSDALIDIPAMAAAETQKSAANAASLLSAFQAAAEKRGVLQDRILEHGLTMSVPDMLVDYARLRDLTIVPLAEGDNIDHWFAESIIFGSGRPTLVLPPKRQKPGPFVLDSVVVAWDFSRPAARAVADALPILTMAKKVFVVTITNEKVIDSKRSGAELAKHLARHGVEVVLDTVDAGGKAIGEVLEGYVASRKADLLVMGAFGHSRLRDFVMGGATKSMLAKTTLPVLLSH
ncbi:MAG: universal stress protein [Pseudolabrys sp.]|nr:universal stress protein [Pseudolabrys sp.]